MAYLKTIKNYSVIIINKKLFWNLYKNGEVYIYREGHNHTTTINGKGEPTLVDVLALAVDTPLELRNFYIIFEILAPMIASIS